MVQTTEVPHSEGIHYHPFGVKFSPQYPLFNHILCSSFNVRDHVSQPYGKTRNIIVLNTLNFKFLDERCSIRHSHHC